MIMADFAAASGLVDTHSMALSRVLRCRAGQHCGYRSGIRTVATTNLSTSTVQFRSATGTGEN
jgi:hypothetical protein